jgi:VPS inhibitor protein E
MLIKQYGSKLIDGTISDQELQALLDSKTFTKSNGYVDPYKPISDLNYSQWNGITDFVSTIGPKIPSDTLNKLTSRLIDMAPSIGDNTFMRNSTLERAFLAFEMTDSPTSAESHFNSDRFNKEFSGPNDIAKLKQVILTLGGQLFELALDKKLQKLIKLCDGYKIHLEKSLKPSSKLDIVNEMLSALQNNAVSKATRIRNMSAVLTEENKTTLKQHRQSSKFLETILNVLSLGIYSKISKGTFAFWKSHGEVLTNRVEEENNEMPKKR